MTPINLPPADTDQPVEAPMSCAPYAVGDGITVLPSYLPVPGMGVLPAHAFLVDGPEPMVVDTGPNGAEGGFQAGLSSVIDPSTIHWIWLTHTDPDHTGSCSGCSTSPPRPRSSPRSSPWASSACRCRYRWTDCSGSTRAPRSN